MRAVRGNDTGYTMTELLLVMVILAILVLIAVMTYVVATGSARAVACRHNQRVFNEGIILYETENNVSPVTIDDLDGYVQNFDANKLCTNQDGVELVYDDVTDTVVCPNHP